MFQLMVNIGVFLAFLLGTVLGWRWMSTVCAVIPCLYALVLLPLPESPLFSLRNGREDQTRSALQWLRGPSYSVLPEVTALRR